MKEDVDKVVHLERNQQSLSSQSTIFSYSIIFALMIQYYDFTGILQQPNKWIGTSTHLPK